MAINIRFNGMNIYPPGGMYPRGWITMQQLPTMMFCSLLIRCGIKPAQTMWDHRAPVASPMIPTKSITENEEAARGIVPLEHFFKELGY